MHHHNGQLPFEKYEYQQYMHIPVKFIKIGASTMINIQLNFDGILNIEISNTMYVSK